MAGPAQPAAALYIGANDSALAFVDTEGAAQTLHLAIGTSSLAAGWLKHSPATPLEIEAAIEAVEDVVMPLHKKLPAGMALFGGGAALEVISALAGAEPGPAQHTLTADAVERVFDRLAAVAGGRPVAHDAHLAVPEVAAALVILREFMHHTSLLQINVMVGEAA